MLSNNMSLFESEISVIKNISDIYLNFDDNELLSFLYENIGIVLIDIQRTEYIIHGIVSHFNESLLKKNKTFKNLSPRIFLDNDEKSKSSRKQTLGQIINFLLDTTSFFDPVELNQFINNRNKFVHNYWREFLSNNRLPDRVYIENALKFTLEFGKENMKWQFIFKGFMYSIIEAIAKLENKEISQFQDLKKYQQDFIDYFTTNSTINK